jgi:multidrug transporter EmrE-like cation transporter
MSTGISFVGPIALVAISLVAYQLAQHTISGASNPWSPLFIAYVVGAAVTGVATLLARPPIFVDGVRLWVGCLVLGIAVVGIEFGYLQAHRAGWNLAIVGLVGSTAGTVALAIISAILFNEPLSPRQGIGIVLALVGLLTFVIPAS